MVRSDDSDRSLFDPRIHVLDTVFTTTPVVGVPLIPYIAFHNAAIDAPEEKVYEVSEIDEFNELNSSALCISLTWTILPSSSDASPRDVKYVENVKIIDDSVSYTPVEADLGCKVKLFCTLRSLEPDPDSVLIHRSKTVLLADVQQFPPPSICSLTQSRDYGAIGRGSPRIKVLSYNVLHDIYCNTGSFPFATSWMLARTYRRRRQIKELKNISADLMCLQEVPQRDFEEIILPALKEAEYDGCFAKKESGFTDAWHDGCATFFKTSIFEMVDKKDILLYSAANERLSNSGAQNVPRFPPVGPVVQVVILGWKEKPRNPKIVLLNIHMSGSAILIARTCGMLTLYNVLSEYLHSQNVNIDTAPIIFCGDFNDAPDGVINEFVRTGKFDFKKKAIQRIANVFENVSNFCTDFENLKMNSAIADANFPSYSEPLYSTATITQAVPADYIFYRGESLLPISSYSTSFEKIQNEMTKLRTARVPNIESSIPNEVNPSDHDFVMADFVIDAETLHQKKRLRSLETPSDVSFDVKDAEFIYRRVSNHLSTIMDTSKKAGRIPFRNIIIGCKSLYTDYNESSLVLDSLSEILTAVIFSRMHYEYGYTVSAKKNSKKARSERELDFACIQRCLAIPITDCFKDRQSTTEGRLLMNIGFTNSNELDSKPDANGQKLREPVTRKLLHVVEEWLKKDHRPQRREIWENFMKTDCVRDQKTYIFPRCRAELCDGHRWHVDTRTEAEIQVERETLDSELRECTLRSREALGTFQSILLHIFGLRATTGSSDMPKYAPRQATVEIITNFLYNELVAIYKKTFSVSKYSGVVMLDEVGFADKIRKQNCERLHKAWLANQIKWYWCQLRPDPYELFERVLRLFPARTLALQTRIQIRDQQETIRKFFYTHKRFTPADKSTGVRFSKENELPCFGLENPNKTARESLSSKTTILGVENNSEVGLNKKLTSTTDLFYN